jgi:hypothetical protein
MNLWFFLFAAQYDQVCWLKRKIKQSSTPETQHHAMGAAVCLRAAIFAHQHGHTPLTNKIALTRGHVSLGTSIALHYCSGRCWPFQSAIEVQSTFPRATFFPADKKSGRRRRAAKDGNNFPSLCVVAWKEISLSRRLWCVPFQSAVFWEAACN